MLESLKSIFSKKNKVENLTLSSKRNKHLNFGAGFQIELLRTGKHKFSKIQRVVKYQLARHKRRLAINQTPTRIRTAREQYNNVLIQRAAK